MSKFSLFWNHIIAQPAPPPAPTPAPGTPPPVTVDPPAPDTSTHSEVNDALATIDAAFKQAEAGLGDAGKAYLHQLINSRLGVFSGIVSPIVDQIYDGIDSKLTAAADSLEQKVLAAVQGS